MLPVLKENTEFCVYEYYIEFHCCNIHFVVFNCVVSYILNRSAYIKNRIIVYVNCIGFDLFLP